MTFDRQTTVARMRTGDRGRIIEIAGGYGLTRRLEAMGIRPGKKITKVSSMLMHGPVTVQVDGVQVAIGFGMARRILVELGSK